MMRVDQWLGKLADHRVDFFGYSWQVFVEENIKIGVKSSTPNEVVICWVLYIYPFKGVFVSEVLEKGRS